MVNTHPELSTTTTIFVHNVKTAGATLRRILSRQYHPSNVLTITGEHYSLREFEQRMQSVLDHTGIGRANIVALQGHVPVGVHELLPGPSRYITLLRDPLSRIQSFYQYRIGQRRKDVFDGDRPLSLAEYIENVQLKELDNAQTRRLSGMDPDFGHCASAMLDVAKHNLRELFAVVGVTDKFDETLVLCKRLLGWKYILYFRLNVTKHKPGPTPPPKELRDLIVKYNELDVELYRYAAETFEQRVAALGPVFADEVAIFKRVNERYARFEVYASKARERTPTRQAARPLASLPFEEQLWEGVFEEHPQLLARQYELDVEIQRWRRREAEHSRQLESAQHQQSRLARELRDAEARRQALEQRVERLERKLAGLRQPAEGKAGSSDQAGTASAEPSTGGQFVAAGVADQR